MATIRFFNGKQRTLPGFYMRNISKIQNKPTPTPFGTVLIIDTGENDLLKSWGSMGAVSGELQNGEDSLHQLSSLEESQAFMKGGLIHKLMEPLFKPASGFNGISDLLFIRAATTIASSMTFEPTGGGSAGGSAVIKTRDEGLVGNGVLVDGKLSQGYGFTFSTGLDDVTKFMLSFWRGTYKGNDANGLPYNDVYQSNATPELVMQSLEFDNMGELKTWMESDKSFNALFQGTVTVTGSGDVDADDLTAYPDTTLSVGGTTTYDAGDLPKVFEIIKNYSYKYIFSLSQGKTEGISVKQSAMVSHITSDAKFVKFIILAGEDSSLDDSIALANNYNSSLVNVVHGNVRLNSSISPVGYRVYSSLYKTAVVLGRMLGLAPQIPVTNKSISIDGEDNPLSDKQRVKALKQGVITTFYNRDRRLYVVTQGINTIMNNEYFISNTENITQISFSTQVMRIISQVDQTLSVNAEKELMSQENGVNQFTLSPEGLKLWIVKQLSQLTVTEQIDNYIKRVDVKSIVVELDEDNYNATYGYYVNGEITKIFVTSTLLG